jgi:hypothetical protein
VRRSNATIGPSVVDRGFAQADIVLLRIPTGRGDDQRQRAARVAAVAGGAA